MHSTFRTPALFVLLGHPLIAKHATAADFHSVQLHIHGSLSEGNGRMINHAIRAREIGTEVLWWTDHAEMTFVREDRLYLLSFDFDDGLSQPTAEGNAFGFVDTDPVGFSTGTFVDTLDNRRAMLLHAEIPAAQHMTDGMFYSVPYNTYERSFFQELTVHLATMPGSQEQSGCCFAIECVFSNDLDGLPIRLYFVAGDTIPPIPPPNVHYRPLPELSPNEWNTLEVSIDEVARTLDPWGRDMSLKELTLGHLAVVEGSTTQLVDDFSIQIDGAMRDSLHVLKANYLDSLPELTPVHFVGTEIAGLPAEVEHHINVYTPAGVAPIPNYDSPLYDPDRYPRNIVAAAHRRGYTVSYNHMGASGYRVGDFE